MEIFRIDFNLSNPFPDGKMLGECGEKNAVELIITPPDDLSSREEIRLYVVAFSTENGPVRYGPVPKAETITVPVSNALTVGTALSVQLEGYDSDGEFVIKSKVLTGITLANSIIESDAEMSDDKVEIPGHSHDNSDVLNSFEDIDGKLLYDNRVVKVENPCKTVVLRSDKSGFLLMADVPFYNTMTFIALKNSEGELTVPDGVIIKKIEVNTSSPDNPEWIDLYDLNDSETFIPYFVNMYKAVRSDRYRGTILATVCFPIDVNNFYSAASNYEVSSIRVAYEESGEK